MTRTQRLQLQHLICAIDTALAEESSAEGAVTLSKESLAVSYTHLTLPTNREV